MRLSKSKIAVISISSLIIIISLSLCTNQAKGFPVDDDMIIDLEVNGVSVDDAMTGSTIPIPPDYTLEFEGVIAILKPLTINFIELTILEAGFPIHDPIRIEEFSYLYIPFPIGVGINGTYAIPEEFQAIISQIRGTHELRITVNYQVEETGLVKELSVIANIFVTYDNPLEVVATGTGVATVAVTVVGVVSTVGAVGAVGGGGSVIGGSYFTQLSQMWKAIKGGKEAIKLSISGIPLTAKIFSMDKLKEFLEMIG